MIVTLYIAGYLLIGFIISLLFVRWELNTLRKTNRQEYVINECKDAAASVVIPSIVLSWPIVVIFICGYLFLRFIVNLL